jgi:hypothetical protein
MSHMTQVGAKKSAPAPRPLVRNLPSRVHGSVRGDWERLLGNRLRGAMTGEAAQPRRCSCGGTCDSCSKEEDQPLRELLARLPGPLRKSLESGTDDEQEILGAPSRGEASCGLRERLDHDKRPHQGAATIVCDGAGDYRVALNSWAGAPCGVEACVRLHEESHAADWRKRWPDGCKNADGTPKPDGADIPLGGPGYDEFLRKSECDAHTVEIPCEQAALDGASKDCKPYVQSVLDDTREQQKKFCGGGC